MTERPIIFSAEMVRAILAGRKTQTRRVIKPQPPESHEDPWLRKDGVWISTYNEPPHILVDYEMKCPYGKPGDVLWVKETWGYHGFVVHCGKKWEKKVSYHADSARRSVQFDNYDDMFNAPPRQNIKMPSNFNSFSPQEQEYIRDEKLHQWWEKKKKIPSIFMPRWASRITLKVTDIRVERVQDISEEDAQAEGCKNDVLVSLDGGDYIGLYARERFEDLWDSINKKRGFGWDANPWVWVIEFKRVNHA